MNRMHLDDNQYFIPPKDVAEEAKKGLILREEFNKGGTKIGWDRARQLKDMLPVSSSDIIRRECCDIDRHMIY